ncbi:MAG TPA: DUF502 domain-containing protein [Gammaproteobacteria bacterium]|nr:DUF502 domain-containing protein [Gammaproteobacteria bacterium]
MRAFGKIFLTGLLALLPVVITVAVLVWLVDLAESVFGELLRLVLGEGRYVYGMGIATGIIAVFLFGLMTRVFLFRRILRFGENQLNRIPLVKTVYSAVRDLMGFFSEKKDQRFSKVVILTLPGQPFSLLGFVTREDFAALPAGMAPEGHIAVYLPMSYMIGGYTVFVPRELVRPVDMSMEDAMRFVVTAGLSLPGEAHK